MKKLPVFICENFDLEFQAAIEREGIDDIELCIFPTLCDHKGGREAAKAVFSHFDHKDGVLVCNQSCDALKLMSEVGYQDTITRNYCFSHFTCDEFLDFLISRGSYIVNSSWLRGWRAHLSAMGFDQETARCFFQETCKKIVLLDAKIDECAEIRVRELASYLGLPFSSVPVKLEGIQLLLKSKVLEWRLHHQSIENSATINEIRSQCADYSAVFDMIGRISTYTSKRDIIGKVKDLFVMIFGAKSFRFWTDQAALLPEDLREFYASEAIYVLLDHENRICIKVLWDIDYYGMIDAGDFLFPQYLDRYLNLALNITKFLGLVFHNNEQFERIVKTGEELKFLSFHDSLTGLYNRTFINQLLVDEIEDGRTSVFMFDIDKLKYVNDHYGHAEGDKLIKDFATIVASCFRESDIVARIGGDEFVAILYDTDEKTAAAIHQRVMIMIQARNDNLHNEHLKLSASIGYAIRENGDETIERLMKNADASMYADKKRRRQMDTR
jgi:diguanylate cyclase (GGDEF)-like protein